VRQLRAFLLLEKRDRRLLASVACVFVVCRLRLLAQKPENVRQWAQRWCNGTAQPERVVWAVRIVSRYMPHTCLIQALALQRMLSTNQFASELKIGVRTSGPRFEAHAWLVDRDNRILIGEAFAESYSVIDSWAVLCDQGAK
jgi:hypothetical protein